MEQEFATLLAAYSLTAVLANKHGTRFDKVYINDEKEVVDQRHIDVDYAKLVEFVQKHPHYMYQLPKKKVLL